MKNSKPTPSNNRRANDEWGDRRECGDSKRYKKSKRQDNNKRGELG